jgi:hypothetical protein
MNLTIKGDTKRLAIGNIPLSERLIVRKATDLPFESFVAENRFGIDTLVVLWWLARRGEGEAMLTLTQCEADFPTDLGADDITVTLDEPDGDDPEA